MDRRLFLRNTSLLAAGVVAADQLELLERLTWKRRFWSGWSPGGPRDLFVVMERKAQSGPWVPVATRDVERMLKPEFDDSVFYRAAFYAPSDSIARELRRRGIHFSRGSVILQGSRSLVRTSV